jgi:hypothetical protein
MSAESEETEAIGKQLRRIDICSKGGQGISK